MLDRLSLINVHVFFNKHTFHANGLRVKGHQTFPRTPRIPPPPSVVRVWRSGLGRSNGLDRGVHSEPRRLNSVNISCNVKVHCEIKNLFHGGVFGALL